MTSTELLRKRQKMLKEQICSNLDILIGTVGKSPAMKYHNLTTKQAGKTVSRYVRKGLVPKVTPRFLDNVAKSRCKRLQPAFD